MANVKFENISFKYGNKVILDNFSLEVNSGEILCLVGPSGCGKTTLIRCLLGLIKPEKGKITIGDRVLFDSENKINVPAEKRNIGIVFQDYAVWPHMTVIENVSYPLKKRGFKKEEVKNKALKALAQVHMTEYANHLPSQLSGGQQQRVAIARALVIDAEILVMDEPITNLDAKLREEMLIEIRLLKNKLNSTILYITHDQQSALTLCDKMAIMQEDGSLCQEGTDEEIILSPVNRFTFEFIGVSNFINVIKENEKIYLDIGKKELYTPNVIKGDEDFKNYNGDEYEMGVRPNDIIFDETSQIKATVTSRIFLGSEYNYFLQLGNKEIRVQQSTLAAKNDGVVNEGDTVGINLLNPHFYKKKEVKQYGYN